MWTPLATIKCKFPPVKYSFSYLSLAFLTPFLSGTLAPNPNTPFCCKTIGWCDFRTHSHCIFSPPSSPPTIYVFGTLSVRRTKPFLAPPKTELALFVKALFFKFCFVLLKKKRVVFTTIPIRVYKEK